MVDLFENFYVVRLIFSIHSSQNNFQRRTTK